MIRPLKEGLNHKNQIWNNDRDIRKLNISQTVIPLTPNYYKGLAYNDNL